MIITRYVAAVAVPALVGTIALGCSSGALVVGSDRFPEPTCNGKLLADLGQEQIMMVIADETHAYVVAYHDPGLQGGQADQGAGSKRTLRVALDGSTGPTPLPVEDTYTLAVDDAHLYFARQSAIFAIPKDGSGPAALLLSNQYADSLAVDGTHVYWTSSGSAPLGSTTNGGGVYRMPKAGGDVQLLSRESLEPWDIVVDDTSVYWNDILYAQAGIVMAAPKDGSSPAHEVARDQMNLAGLSTDATNVYWATGGGGDIVARPKAGGDVRTLASPGSTVGVVATGASVYFTSSGRLMSVAPTGGAPRDLGCAVGVGTFAVTSTSVVVAAGSKLFLVSR